MLEEMKEPSSLDFKPKSNQSDTLGYANQCFKARNLPVCLAVPHFPHRDATCMDNGPMAQITLADKNHARFRFQRSIYPRHGVRGANSLFDLNDLRHYARLPWQCFAS